MSGTMADPRRFQIPAIVDGVSPLKDGGMSIRLHTNEVNDAEKLVILGFYQKFGWFLFQEEEYDDSVELEAVRRDTGGKSPSQRLRNVLHVAYTQSGNQSITFEQYYAQKMERFIDKVKENLN